MVNVCWVLEACKLESTNLCKDTIIIVLIQNSENVGFSQLIRGYKHTVIASWCTTFHNRVTEVYDILPLITAKPRKFNCKSLFEPQAKIFSILEYQYLYYETLKLFNICISSVIMIMNNSKNGRLIIPLRNSAG